MGSKPGVMSRIANEQLTEGPRESSEVLFQWTLTKSENDQNLMLGVYLSIKTNSLTVRNISLFTVFDLSTPLNAHVNNTKHKNTIERVIFTTGRYDFHYMGPAHWEKLWKRKLKKMKMSLLSFLPASVNELTWSCAWCEHMPNDVYDPRPCLC